MCILLTSFGPLIAMKCTFVIRNKGLGLLDLLPSAILIVPRPCLYEECNSFHRFN